MKILALLMLLAAPLSAQTVGRVTVVPQSRQVAIGDTVHFSAIALGPDGLVVPVSNAAFQWTSKDTTIIKVDSLGIGTAVGTGVARVTVTFKTGKYITMAWLDSLDNIHPITVEDGAHLPKPGDTVRYCAYTWQGRTMVAGNTLPGPDSLACRMLYNALPPPMGLQYVMVGPLPHPAIQDAVRWTG